MRSWVVPLILVAGYPLLLSCGPECGTGTEERDGECVSAVEGGRDAGTGGKPECLPDGEPTVPESEDALRAYLEGRWLLCNGASLPEAPGIEVEADGGWRFLRQDDSGELVPDWTRSGSYIDIFDSGADVEIDRWQILFHWADGGVSNAAVGLYPAETRRLFLSFAGWDCLVDGWYLEGE